MSLETEILTGVSVDELEALAAGVLVPTAQQRLDDLVNLAKQNHLSEGEGRELDTLLHQVDQLNLLKARARYTIHQLGAKVLST